MAGYGTMRDPSDSDDATRYPTSLAPLALSSPRHGHGGVAAAVSSLRTNQERRDRVADDWTERCNAEEDDVRAEAMRIEQQLRAALQSTSHLGSPNAFRTAICFDVLGQISSKYSRFEEIMGILQREVARAVYVTPPTPLPSKPEKDLDEKQQQQIQAARVQRFFEQQTFFVQLRQVLERKAKLQSQLDGLDAMHGLMIKQLRHEERMVEKVATRWAKILLKQTLVDWKKIIVRKKYTRVLLEKTSARWGKQRLLRQFRQWIQFTKTSKVAKVREMIQQCGDQTRDFEELLTKMEVQIDTAKTETRSHREHYDFAKRQILSLEELLAQLEHRVHNSNERKLQAIANEWGRLCLAFVDCQLDYLQNMLGALTLDQYADPSLLLQKGEELPDLLRLPADALVLRWINFHLSKCSTFQYYEASPIGFIQNFSSDMKNNYVLRHILHRILNQADQVSNLMKESPAPAPTSPTRRKAPEDSTSGAAQGKVTPFASKDELRSALEEKLNPSCPVFLSAQAVENEIPSDLAFAIFSFLACEHPTLFPTVMREGSNVECCLCPWKEAQLALGHAYTIWDQIRSQWTELHTPFTIREVAPPAPDLTTPPHLLVRGNIALQNAVNMVQYACSKRSVMMKVWGCLQRTIQQDAMRVLVNRGRQEQPWEMIDRRLWREKYMLTTLQVPKLLLALGTGGVEDGRGRKAQGSQLEAELLEIELILNEFYDELRRVYRYYASIDAELQRTDHLLRHHKAGAPIIHRDAQDEERFFRKISLSMSLVEFHVFLKDCRVFGTARPFPYEFIERVFEQVNLEVAAAAQVAHAPVNEALYDHNVSEMTPAEFVEALVHIAQSKYVRFRHATHVSTMSLSQRFRRMLVDVVLPNAMQEKERVNVFHEQLLAGPCREVLMKHQRALQAVYMQFAELGFSVENTTKKQNRMLSVNGLVVLLKHFGMLRENFLNLDEVQHILSEVLQLERDGIQLDLQVVQICLAALKDGSTGEEGSSNGRAPGNKPAEDLLFITFAEFIEVLGAVACYLRPDAFVPLADKLDDFFTEELQIQSASLPIREKT